MESTDTERPRRTPPPSPWRRLRTWPGWSRPLVRVGAVAALLVLIVVAVMAGTGVRHRPRSPEETARGFFEALAAGDTDRARGFATRDSEDGYRTDFLAPQAIRSDWRLESVHALGGDRVDVAVTGPGGPARFTLDTAVDGGERRLVRPYGTVTFVTARLAYGEVNGVGVDLPDNDVRFLLFPGYYTFYDDRPGYVDVSGDAEPVAIVPGAAEPTYVQPTGNVTFGPRMLASAEAATRAVLDRCTADTARIDRAACLLDPAEFGLTDPTGITWTIEAYPEVEVIVLWPMVEYGDDWAVQATVPGRITLRGTHTGADGKPADFDLDCTLTGELYFASVGLTGVTGLREAERSWNGLEPVHCTGEK